ncbi:MAG: 6-pyruvoyl-tetrahydropterin synthase-related protein [Anaerolineae bacterium]|nr:6-pyruvoyl-tetrahydropterin synthase-related protein [Anaerolineae bacterium]
MRGQLKRFDAGFLVVLLICGVALWPFIGRTSLPQGTDAELHVFRLAELSRLVLDGSFYPRWAPNFYYGFGYPIFNYYAPLTYYLALPMTWLFDPVFGVKAMFIVGLIGAALGMYGFVRDNWGRPGGYVAAAIFVYAPYLQYIDPHARGVMPETFSFAVFALTLWAFDRFRRSGSAASWLAITFGLAATVLTHNLMAMVFGGLLFGWFAWQIVTWQTASELRRQFGRYGLLAFVLGVGLAAFFWLPLGLERDAVNLSTLVGEGSHYDFRNHFLTVRDLLEPSRRLDWGASEPLYNYNLGVVQWVLGGVAVVLWFGRKVRHWQHTAFFVSALAVLIFLMLPVSNIVWQAVPLLPFLQFPWRLLGAAAAMLAVLSGVATDALLTHSWLADRVKLWVAPVFVGATLLVALPLSQVRPWQPFGGTEPVDGLNIELTGRWLGTTSTADFVPSTVEVVPREEPHVLAGYFWNDGVIDHLNIFTIPEEALVESEIVSLLHTRFTVDTPVPFALRLYIFAFPGWEVLIDGEPVDYELGTPEGFIVVPVDAGRHIVDVRFGTTLPRQAGWIVAGLSLLALLWAGWRLQKSKVGREDSAETYPQSVPFERGIAWRNVGLVAVLTISLVVVLEPLDLLHANSTGFTVAGAQQDLAVNFGDQIALIGVDMPTGPVEPGDTLDLTLYWKAMQPLADNYRVFVHVLRPDDNVTAQSDKLNPGDFPTERWSADEYVRDRHRLTIPQTIPPGDYRLIVGLWQPETGRLPVSTDQTDYYQLRTITID